MENPIPLSGWKVGHWEVESIKRRKVGISYFGIYKATSNDKRTITSRKVAILAIGSVLSE